MERPASVDIALEVFKPTESPPELPIPNANPLTQTEVSADVSSAQNDSSSQVDPQMSADEEARSQLAAPLAQIDGGKRAW